MASDPNQIYDPLEFGPIPAGRPFTYINMVATIDGKTVSGARGEDVLDLGSKFDHRLMRRIEDVSDGVIVGASTLRATTPSWDPKTPFRVVVTRSGNLPYKAGYFQGRTIVVTPEATELSAPEGVEHWRVGQTGVDFAELVHRLRGLGVEKLLSLGGSELNAELLRRDLVDELFLTVAPKIKLGRDVPTYAGGDALPREDILRFRLLECHAVEDEVFLRYRRESQN